MSYENEDIERKILDGKYLAQNAPDYPGSLDNLKGDDLRDRVMVIREIQRRLDKEFDRDLLATVGLTGHPKAQRALDIVRSMSQDDAYISLKVSQQNAYIYLKELAELILD